MKNQLIKTAQLCGLMLVLAAGTIQAEAQAEVQAQQVQTQYKIQLAILLDTSNSMDGLIDQTRSQLWQMVNELTKAKKRGITPELQVAVYEYGNDSISPGVGHVRKITGLTTDLDKVSEALFALQTNGGSEYCGYAIDTAVKNLQWSNSQDDLRLIYIAGNEPFSQGPINYTDAIKLAKEKGIDVSTIFAGNHEEGVATGWQQGALLASGSYMSIDPNQQIVHIAAPQDQKIAELNTKLNSTYIPYGAEGKVASQRQQEQDQKNSDVSLSLLAQRVKSKVSSAYTQAQWDLVDALESGEVELEEIDEQSLPAPMAAMSPEEKKKFVADKKTERDALKTEIARLAQARDDYVAEEKQKLADSQDDTMDEVLIESIKSSAKEKDFAFE